MFWSLAILTLLAPVNNDSTSAGVRSLYSMINILINDNSTSAVSFGSCTCIVCIACIAYWRTKFPDNRMVGIMQCQRYRRLWTILMSLIHLIDMMPVWSAHALTCSLCMPRFCGICGSDGGHWWHSRRQSHLPRWDHCGAACDESKDLLLPGKLDFSGVKCCSMGYLWDFHGFHFMWFYIFQDWYRLCNVLDNIFYIILLII